MIKFRIGLLICLAFVFTISCGSFNHNIRDGQLPKEDEGIVFVNVLFVSDGYGLELDMHPKGYLNMWNSNKIVPYALHLSEDTDPYSVTQAKLGNGFFHFKGTSFIVKKNFINYAGTYKITLTKSTTLFDAKCYEACIADDNSYKSAVENFKLYYPNLASKYEFRNAVINP